MFAGYDERPSDSPLVECVWRCRSDAAGDFVSVAAGHVEAVVTRLQSRTLITFRGPETKASIIDYPRDADWIGIRFKLGTFVPTLPPRQLRDRQDANLPAATARAFWLNGSAIEYPTFDRAEGFVARLARQGSLVRDPNIEGALHGRRPDMTLRSVQRHFLHATGLTISTLRQIERARYATVLLQSGVSILDVVRLAGYYDQAHLTRSLTHRMAQTPVQIRRAHSQLSLNLTSLLQDRDRMMRSPIFIR